MSIRLKIQFLLLVLAIGSFWAAKRFPPFSNYPMFVYTLNERIASTMILEDLNGKKSIISNEQLRPITRLALLHMVTASKSKNTNYLWSHNIFNRILNKSNYRGFQVVDIKYDIKTAEFKTVKVLYESNNPQ